MSKNSSRWAPVTSHPAENTFPQRITTRSSRVFGTACGTAWRTIAREAASKELEYKHLDCRAKHYDRGKAYGRQPDARTRLTLHDLAVRGDQPTQGLILAKTGQAKEGEKILREAVKIRTESLPKEHYWVALANSALGECLTIQQRYDEAEPLLLGSYESLNNSQGTNNPRTRLALQQLIEVYEKWRKPDLAARYRAML
jgi:hypothetical protein